MYLDNFLDKAYSVIEEKHSFHEKVSKKLFPLKNEPSPNGAEALVVGVKKGKPDGLVSGVDSGFASKKLSFIDLVLVRTAGVVFYFKGGALQKTEYFPSAFSFPEPLPLKLGLENDEQSQSVSFERLKQEIGLSIKIIEKFKPNFLFIDGSIVPQYQDKPRGDSKINEEYSSVVALFQHLYSVAEKNSCTLIACVEDSRGTRFRQILEEEVLPAQKNLSVKSLAGELKDSFDASLLDYFLVEGERTFAFHYTKNTESHAILKDYNPAWSKNIFVFYLKASNFDKPIRVEFISKGSVSELKKKADEISSLVFALSSLHREYCFPSILIEADMRARLNEQDISVVYDKLIDKLGPKVRMRRNARPFK